MTEPRIELIPARHAVCSDAVGRARRARPHHPAAARGPLPEDAAEPRAGARPLRVDGRGEEDAVRPRGRGVRCQAALADRPGQRRRSSTTWSKPSSPAARRPTSRGWSGGSSRSQPRGSTDLHGGWAEGGRQAEAGLVPGGVNRVLLLSDGLANVGVVDPNTIAAEARGLAARGVGTTTMGVGDDYNEDLMEAMARAGDGRYYYIESPVQLVDIFQTELQGLMDTLGQKVSLGLEPKDGVAVTDVLNDLEKAPTGRLMLPNLVVDMPRLVVVRLKLPPSPAGTTLLEVRLAWDAPRDGGRRVLRRRSATCRPCRWPRGRPFPRTLTSALRSPC